MANSTSTRSRRVLARWLTLALVATAAAVPATAWAVGPVDQEQLVATSGIIVGSDFSNAQVFTAGVTGSLDQVDLFLSEVSATEALVVEIRNASGGVPGTTVLASANVEPANVPADPAFVSVGFNQAVEANTQYAIVVYGSQSDEYRWFRSADSGSYSAGNSYQQSDAPPVAGHWSESLGDFAFRTYVTQTPTTEECDGLPATIVGTENGEEIAGTSGDDVIVGLGGNDTIIGEGGHDVICGGDGNDTLTGSAGNDTINGDAGDDRLVGSAGNDTLNGGDGADKLTGSAGSDTLDGGSGTDSCKGEIRVRCNP
jgi:Ca2+-binding RTX toxin-like protein